MKNITKLLALTVLFTGFAVNADVDLKQNNFAETTKTTNTQKVIKFAKDHKKKLIAGTAFAVLAAIEVYGLYLGNNLESLSFYNNIKGGLTKFQCKGNKSYFVLTNPGNKYNKEMLNKIIKPSLLSKFLSAPFNILMQFDDGKFLKNNKGSQAYRFLPYIFEKTGYVQK